MTDVAKLYPARPAEPCGSGSTLHAQEVSSLAVTYALDDIPQTPVYREYRDWLTLGVPVAGVDEVGRGCCAGPITAAAVILPPWDLPELEGLTDSKKLTARRREHYAALIKDKAVAWAVASVSVADIEKIGLQAANHASMRLAVEALDVTPGKLLVDAVTIANVSIAQESVIRGDSECRSIAAASVLAKVARDTYMEIIAPDYEVYGFAKHKGYGTQAHMTAIETFGVSDQHRRSYKNVRAAEAIYLARTSNELPPAIGEAGEQALF